MAKAYHSRTAPRVSYNAALSLDIGYGNTLASASVSAFKRWTLEQTWRLSPARQADVQEELRESDYSYLPDRWHCLLTLLEAGMPLPRGAQEEGMR